MRRPTGRGGQAAILLASMMATGCGGGTGEEARGPAASVPAAPSSPEAEGAGCPSVDLSSLPAELREEAEASRAQALATPDDPNAVGALGMRYLAHDFPGAAAKCFDRSAHLAPDRWEWFYYLALALEATGQIEPAVKALERVLEIAPDYAPACVRQGNLLLETDRVGAAALYRRALEINPDSATAWFGLGNVARMEGRDEEAVEDFGRAVAQAPDYADAHYALAMLLSARGDRAAAEEHLKRHAAGGPPPTADDTLADHVAKIAENAAALRDRAEQLARRGDTAGAVELLERSIERDVSGSTSHIHLGLVLARQARFEEAAKQFRQALEADPASVEARSSLGLALTELGRPEEAIREFDEVLARHPDHAPSLIYKGRVLLRQGRIDEGLGLLERGVAAQPANGLYRLTLGEALAAAGRNADAIPHLRVAVEAMPAHVRARYVYGVALARTGVLDEAKSQWEEALRLQPTLAEAHLGLAGVALEKGDAAGAVRHAERACELTGYAGRFSLETLEQAYRAAARPADAARIRRILAGGR